MKKLTPEEIGEAQRAMSIEQCRLMILREEGPEVLAQMDAENGHPATIPFTDIPLTEYDPRNNKTQNHK